MTQITIDLNTDGSDELKQSKRYFLLESSTREVSCYHRGPGGVTYFVVSSLASGMMRGKAVTVANEETI